MLSARGGAPPEVPEARGARRPHLPGRGLRPRRARPAARQSGARPRVWPGGARHPVMGLRTRALADADAAVSRLLDARDAPDVPPDLRIVTRVVGPAPTSSTTSSPTSASPTCTTSPTTPTCRATPSAGSSPVPVATPCGVAPTSWWRRSTPLRRRRERPCRAVRRRRCGAPSGPGRRRRPRSIGTVVAEHTATLGDRGPGGARPVACRAARRPGAARTAGRRPLGHRPARQRRRVVWVDRGAGSSAPGPGARRPTCGPWPSASPASRVAGSMTPSPGSTACCRAGSGSTPCCHRSPTAGRT